MNVLSSCAARTVSRTGVGRLAGFARRTATEVRVAERDVDVKDDKEEEEVFREIGDDDMNAMLWSVLLLSLRVLVGRTESWE